MKKTIIVFVAFLLVLAHSYGQKITTDPAVPTMGKVIKIYYDSSKEDGDLHNYTGDLYAHTGVTLAGGLKWQNVIGTWAVNSSQPKLNYLGNFRYELIITPDIKSFYGLSASQKVTEIDLVLRNPTGSLQTRPDIFIPVFETGLNAVFTLPEKQSLVIGLNKTVNISASATMADSLTLYIDNKYIKSGSTPDLVTHAFSATQYGEYWIKAVAWDKPSSAADSFFIYVRRPVVQESLPPGLTDGINYTGPSSATLVLHAPYKAYAFAVGDFNGWRPGEEGYMKVTPDGERYWLELSGLTSAREYRFQYLVDSTFIAEPYSDKLLDPVNDQYITDETYPGLIKYPKDTASGIVSVLQTSQAPYEWQSTSYQPPDMNRLVIYEVLVRDFLEKHDFKTLTDTLDYLQRLGVNAIELMPVTEFEGNLSWGYNVSFYFSPDKYYGPKNSLKALVDSCHSRGIAVIIDLVLNHCFGQSPFVQLYLDYYASDQIVMKMPNPWFNAVSPNPVYKWGADFNHESTATQNLVDRINKYWITEFKVDGFRFDFTKGFTNTPGDGSTYDESRINILKRMAGKIWQVNPSAYVILEHLAPNSEEKILAESGMILWGNLNYQYGEAVMGYPSDLSSGIAAARGWSIPNLVTYMESHDEERLMYKTLNFGAAGSGYNTRDTETALKRMELASLFFLTIPGPKMIWQFGELGYDISIDFNGRTGNKPILWGYTEIMPRYRLNLVYSLLNALKSRHPVFSTSDFTWSLADKQKQLWLNSADMKVNIMGNFDVGNGQVVPAFQQTGKWYEYFTGDSINVTAVNDAMALGPGEYRMYTTKRLGSPKKLLGIEDDFLREQDHPVQLYPNPSDGEIFLRFSSITDSSWEIVITDLSGRSVYNDIIPAGTEIYTPRNNSFNAREMKKGVYLITLRAGNRSANLKMVRD